ncbi:YtxH domain-containing protein [uncultured Gammaproteobacteria bacterium]
MTYLKRIAKRHGEERQQATAPHVQIFWSSFVAGLGAVSLLGVPTFDPPRYSGVNVAGHWRAVGGQMRNAIRRYDDIEIS